MKLTVARLDLMTAVDRVRRVVPEKSATVLLRNIRIHARTALSPDHGLLRITGTDLDISIECKVPATVEIGGSITVNCQVLFGILKKSKADNISLELDHSDQFLMLRAGRSRFKLHTLPASDFPSLSDDNSADGNEFVLTETDVFHLFRRPEFAMAKNDQRYYLMGLFLQALSDTVRSVATDGHRIAVITRPLPDGASGIRTGSNEFGIIVPRKTVAELRKLDDETLLKFRITRSKVTVTGERTQLISRLIDAQYPDFERVIPKNNTNIITMNRVELVDALELVSPVMAESHAVKMQIEGDKMLLSVTNRAAGSADGEIAIRYNGDPITIGFNGKMMLEALGQMEKDTDIELQLADTAQAGILQGAEDRSAMFVQMPMRVS